MTISAKNLKSIIKNGDVKMAEKIPAIDEVEKLLVLKQHRANPFGKRKPQIFFPGDTYEQAGLDKLEVLGGKDPKCTRDLKEEVPKNLKRKAPAEGAAKFADPVAKLSGKIDKLVDVFTDFVKAQGAKGK